MPFDATPVDPQLARLRQLADELDRFTGPWDYRRWSCCAVNVAVEAGLMADTRGRSALSVAPLAKKAFGLNEIEFSRLFCGGFLPGYFQLEPEEARERLSVVTAREVAAEIRQFVREKLPA